MPHVTIFSSSKGDIQFNQPPTYMTSDPLVTTDYTAGFVPGDMIINTATGRIWTCAANTVGNAQWMFSGTVVGNPEPSGIVTQFGSGTASFPDEGNLLRSVSGAGISPGATGVDSVLSVYSLPANSFDISGRGINVIAEGSFANNTNVKRTKIIFNPSMAVVGQTIGTGGITIADSGTYSTTGAVGWSIEANVFKYGNNGSNTQLGVHVGSQIGATVGSLLVPSLITAVENAAILVAVTGNATTATTDILLNFVEINAMN